MKQTVALLAVTLAIVLAVTGLIVSANLRQAELITEKTTQQTDLLGKLNRLSLDQEALEKSRAETQRQLTIITRIRDELVRELEAATASIQAANDAILQLRAAGEQTEAIHAQALSAVSAQLEAALLDTETLAGERNSAVLRQNELSAQAQTNALALQALRAEMAAFARLLSLLDGMPANAAGRERAAASLLTAISAFEEAYPKSVLRLPAALCLGLAGETEERDITKREPVAAPVGIMLLE